MERKRRGSLSCGEEEEDGDRWISPRKRTKVRYAESSYDDVEEEDDDDEEEHEEEEEEPGPSTTYYGSTQKNNRLWTVTCGTKTGLLNKAKLKRGAKCIKYDGRWFDPPAFENLGGKSYCRKWKATIFHENKPLQHWFEEGYLTTTTFKRGSAQTPKKKTGPYMSKSSSEEEEKTEDKDHRDKNELSGSEEPEWETEERSSKAANDTSVEDSLQDTSRDKEDQMESESVSAAANQELKAKLVRTYDIRNVRVVLERLPETDLDSSWTSGPSLSGGLKEERVEEFTPSSERKEKVEDESGIDSSPLTTAEELTQSSDRKEAQTEKEVVKEEDKTGINLSLVSTAEELTQSSDRKEAQTKEEVVAVVIEEEDKTTNNSSPLSTEEEFTPSSESKEARTEEVVVVLKEEDDDKIGNNSSPLTTVEGFSQSSDRKAQIEGEEEEMGNNSPPVSTAEGFTPSSERKEAQKEDIVTVEEGDDDKTGNNSSPPTAAGFMQSSDVKEAVEEEEGEDGTGNNSSPVSTAASSGSDVAPDSEVVQSIDSNAANLSSPPGLFVTVTDTGLVGDVKGRGEERGEDGPETQSRCHKGSEECRNAYEGNIVTAADGASHTFTTGYKTSWAASTRKSLKKERVENDPDMDSYDSGEDTTSSHDAAQPQPLKQDERAFQACHTPGTTNHCCDLDRMDLRQLRMEKMRMQIKVLKLQGEFYAGKIKALQKSS